MDESSTALSVALDPRSNLNDVLARRVADAPDGVIIERRLPAGSWEPISTRQFDAEVVAIAKGLVARGIAPGDRVAIMSRTRYEWTVFDWAAWAAGAVPVPIYETSSADQIAWIVADAGVRVLVVENERHRETVDGIRDELPGLTDVVVIDDNGFEELRRDGISVSDVEIRARRAGMDLDDLATIIYTSGTTGRPKGAELTHGNFASLAVNAVAEVPEVFGRPGARTLLFMPLAHVFARFIEVLALAGGSVLGHTPDTAMLPDDLAAFRPTYILSVPRVFEKVYNSAEQKAAAHGRLRIFQWATATAISYSRALDEPGGPRAGLRLRHALADHLVYGKLRAALGGQIEYAVSGGAPLGERLGHFYRGIGVRVLEGYGLTESTAPTCVNRPASIRIGTVGTQLPGCAVRIASDGEILLRGHHVFRGYHGDPAASAAAFTDGWFRTGDMGALDEDGYLRITGRLKEIIVTAGGKNVAPAVLEDRIRAHALISQCVVVGDRRPFIAALVTLDPEGLPGWLAMHAKPSMDVAQAAADPEVHAAIEAAVARANRAVSRAESVRKFSILTSDFTIENGYLTPSLKIKRDLVHRDFADAIDELYADGPAPLH